MADIFSIPERIISGSDALFAAVSLMKTYGDKALVVTDATMVKVGIVERLTGQLDLAGINYVVFDRVCGEPTDTMVMDGREAYREGGCSFLIAIGGGSAMDAMKAIAMMTACTGKLSDYMGREITGHLPPMAAVPTTAGTGSEVTQFTIITDTQTETKMLLKGRVLMPDMAVIVPEYSVSTPKNITASTGLDALTHAVEAFTSKKAQPLSDTMALSAVKRIFRYLPVVYAEGGNLEARNQMALAALEAGIAFNNASVTLVHGMSRPIGALFHVPHGISNAMLLGVCLSYALDGAYERFAALGRAVGVPADTGDKEAAYCFLHAAEKLCRQCEIPTLEQYGIPKQLFFEKIDKMAEDAVASKSPANTRKPVGRAEIIDLYRRLW